MHLGEIKNIILELYPILGGFGGIIVTSYLVYALDLDLTLIKLHLGAEKLPNFVSIYLKNIQTIDSVFRTVTAQKNEGHLSEATYDQFVSNLNAFRNKDHLRFIENLKPYLRFPEKMIAHIRQTLSDPTLNNAEVKVLFTLVSCNHRYLCGIGVLEALLGQDWQDIFPPEHIVMRANASIQTENKNPYIEELVTQLIAKHGGNPEDYTVCLVDDTEIHCKNAIKASKDYVETLPSQRLLTKKFKFNCFSIHADTADETGVYIDALRNFKDAYLRKLAYQASEQISPRPKTPLAERSPNRPESSLRSCLTSSTELPLGWNEFRENTPSSEEKNTSDTPSPCPTPPLL